MSKPTGLSSAEVAARQQQGKTNRPPKSPTKTVGQIVRDNVCSYFNLVFVVLACMLASVGSWLNMGFLGVVFWNTLIGVVQQLRAKKTIDQLTLVSARKVRCLRDGTWTSCLSEDLVQDDVVAFGAGDQIIADAVVLEGSVQVNESLITGEARAVPKAPGGELRSGSFLMAGHCTARLTRVGEESYANRLTAAAQADGHKVAKGEMMRSLDRLIQAIGLGLIPVGAALFWKQHWVMAMDLRSSVESMVAALIGMIPEGLYLLTSVALAIGMLRLARRRVLTQDMKCIETLARVDVLCVDKTGTITESVMEADAPIPLADGPLEDILHSYYGAEEPDNDTGRALKARFGQGSGGWPVTGQIPFNTAYKYSAKSFGTHGVYVVGAPNVVAGTRSGEFRSQLTPLLAQGRRVLLLARYDGSLPDPPETLDPERLTFLALLPLQNRIRSSAPKTFAYFAEQGVAIKVISGDDPQAVSHVAAQAGIAGAQRWVDAATLPDDQALAQAAADCTVFGRVTPEQKRKLVHALQKQGHTVAMTGDGVNDVLALKDADCGIAMASGAQAASQVAQLVLLDSDFAALPNVVAEGRRVINNIQRSASLFLVKNIFSLLLSLVTLCLPLAYPFQPLQLSLISAVTIGLPSFVLALEPNYELVRGKFMHNVLHAALPGGLTDFLLVFCAQGFAYAFDLSADALGTISTLLVLETGLIVLFGVCHPFTPVRWALWGSCTILGLGGAVLFAPWLELIPLDLGATLVLAVLAALVLPVLHTVTGVVDRLWEAGRRLLREKKSV
ncbi:HAD-IC family P-type ATPase [uncultured Subdoligranulum sp.]|uniref:HAD-IC family P-type ATPase n=1 Tax=uncultured Subdoligranulum sp. TaxID=512298 RepID=UPI002605F9B4|nr:HAD-IC family P-type ATPase [uncultured Subdoligranulum sp.]